MTKTKTFCVIEVDSPIEADEIRRGLSDPSVRGFVRVMAALLPNDAARGVGLRYFRDFVNTLKSTRTTPGCDCDQHGNPDPAYHATDCTWRTHGDDPQRPRA
jgi:hypothetical protein